MIFDQAQYLDLARLNNGIGTTLGRYIDGGEIPRETRSQRNIKGIYSRIRPNTQDREHGTV